MPQCSRWSRAQLGCAWYQRSVMLGWAAAFGAVAVYFLLSVLLRFRSLAVESNKRHDTKL